MSQLREYEVILVLSTNLEEEPRKKFIEEFAGVLTHGEGEAAAPIINLWGRRQLAYPIKKQTDGFYVFYEAVLDGTEIRGIERNLNYNESVLRYLFVRRREDVVEEESEEAEEAEAVEAVEEEASTEEAAEAPAEETPEAAAVEVEEEAPAEEAEAPAEEAAEEAE